jgi:hypothetical protein
VGVGVGVAFGVGGIGVEVDGIDVAVGGTGVEVGGIGVDVGGTDVEVDGLGVEVAVGSACPPPHPAVINTTNNKPNVCFTNILLLTNALYLREINRQYIRCTLSILPLLSHLFTWLNIF